MRVPGEEGSPAEYGTARPRTLRLSRGVGCPAVMRGGIEGGRFITVPPLQAQSSSIVPLGRLGDQVPRP